MKTNIRASLEGKKFGKWEVLSFAKKVGNSNYWNCMCACGKTALVDGYQLTSGRSKSCRCIKDLTGSKFGRWTVLSFSRKIGWNKYWNCVCECGATKEIAGYSLECKNSTSCGCYRKEKSALPAGEAAMHAVHRNYTRTAKKKNRDFLLSMDEFRTLTSSNCHYCGCVPNQKIEKVNVPESSRPMNGNYVYNGIDRINNEKGYTTENCVPCCIVCNRAKNNMDREDFVIWVEKIYKNLFSEPRTQTSP